MSFDDRDIRPAMDVYTLDHVYLGSVLRIMRGPAHTALPAPAPDHEASAVGGELLGPMPTQPLGNRAPLLQSAAARYGTSPDAAAIGAGALVVGRWWGLRGRWLIPLTAVQTVALERVVLRLRAADLARRDLDRPAVPQP